MKKILLLALLFTACQSAMAQYSINPVGGVQQNAQLRGMATIDSALTIPLSDTGMVRSIVSRFKGTRMEGTFAWAGNQLMIYRGGLWRSPNGGAPSAAPGTMQSIAFTPATGQTWTVTNPSTTPQVSLALTPAAVNLGNVNNTADMSKPVSMPQQAALAAKQDALSGYGLVLVNGSVISYDSTPYAPLASPSFTGNVATTGSFHTGQPSPNGFGAIKWGKIMTGWGGVNKYQEATIDGVTIWYPIFVQDNIPE
jgi:hypothetical protein